MGPLERSALSRLVGLPPRREVVVVISIEPHSHEFDANLVFSGLGAFFAADRRVKDGGGSVEGSFTADGERWIARLSYQSSNILPPEDGQLPTGREFELETVREYRLLVKRSRAEDEIGDQSFSAHLAPRWQGMRGEKSDGTVIQLSVPDAITEGVNVRVQGSNIRFERYRKLLQRAAHAVGINPGHLEKPHPCSNIQDAAREVRVHRDASGPVHARDGPIAELGHLLEHDRGGYRKVVQDDQYRPGHYHTVTLGPRRVREVAPTHSAPVEIKHYYALDPDSLPEDHPLAHPKVCVSLQSSRWRGNVTLLEEHAEAKTEPAIALETLVDELDTMLRAVLADAGLDLAPSENAPGPGDRGPFVTDAYWPADVSSGWDSPIALDLSHVRQDQESVVIRHLADGGLSPVQWESLETLVADGGEVSPDEIAEEHGRHPGSVRRALRDMEDLVHREYAQVSLRSRLVAEHVHEAVKEAREATRRAVETSAKAIGAAERGLEEHMSAFVTWASRHGIDVDGARDARMTLRFGDVPTGESRHEIKSQLRRGLELWLDAGLPRDQYVDAKLRFGDGSGGFARHFL